MSQSCKALNFLLTMHVYVLENFTLCIKSLFVSIRSGCDPNTSPPSAYNQSSPRLKKQCLPPSLSCLICQCSSMWICIHQRHGQAIIMHLSLVYNSSEKCERDVCDVEWCHSHEMSVDIYIATYLSFAL